MALKSAVESAMPGTKVFVDNDQLRHGHFWQPALLDAIASSDAFLILISNRLGDWQKLEYYEARDRKARDDNYVLLPVIIADRDKGLVANLPGLTQFHWVESTEPTAPEPLSKIITALQSDANTKQHEPWRTLNPYRGLVALEEQDADFFFGRDHETRDIISALVSHQESLVALVGNSGVGKSSLVQAGVIGTLKRQRFCRSELSWPQNLQDSRAWAFLTMKPGDDPIAALVSEFAELWYPDATDPNRIARRNEWTKLLRDGAAQISDLIEATDRRFATDLALTPPPRLFLYIDQGEELYSRTPPDQRRRFSEIIANGLGRTRQRLTVMTSLRADYYGDFQANHALFPLSQKIDVAPLDQQGLSLVLREPARVLGVKFESEKLVPDVVAAAEAEPGALPLLADLITDMWERMRERGDGVLRHVHRSEKQEMIQIGATLALRAEQFLSSHPGSHDAVKRLFTLKLAHVPRQGEPVRARMERSSRPDQHEEAHEWSLVEQLAGPEWRLLVVGEKDGVPTAEVAHEILLKTWPSLKRWLDQERDFLVWRGELGTWLQDYERARSTKPSGHRQALLMGFQLATALKWLKERQDAIEPAARDFIRESEDADRRVARNWQRLQASVVVLLLGVIVGMTGWINQQFLKEKWFWLSYVSQHVLDAAAEAALMPGQPFRECAQAPGSNAEPVHRNYSTFCPEMVVLPSGEFMMGGPGAIEFIPPIVATQKLSLEGSDAPRTEHERDAIAIQQHRVVFRKPFAVAKFEITAEQWQACVDYGACAKGGGAGKEPVSGVSWNEAQDYVRWLSRVTGKTYRLLTEAEWEYAARAGTTTAYFWGDEVGVNNANCRTCGSKWDFTRASPVGSFKPNAYGLYDLHGNVWEWCEDVYHDTYEGAPGDGSAWMEGGDARSRVIRSASWYHKPINMKSDVRNWFATGNRTWDLGFRVARTLEQ